MESKFSYTMNQFAPTGVFKGALCLQANLDSFAGVVDSTQSDALLPGDPIMIVATSTGLPHFKKAAVGDLVMGFVKWTAKKQSYAAGEMCEACMANDVMYMEADAAVNAGVAVNVADLTNVQIAAAGANKSVIGYTLEKAANAGEMVRVRIAEPVVLTANA